MNSEWQIKTYKVRKIVSKPFTASYSKENNKIIQSDRPPKDKTKCYLVCDRCFENIQKNKRFRILDKAELHSYYDCNCSINNDLQQGELCNYCGQRTDLCYLHMEYVEIYN